MLEKDFLKKNKILLGISFVIFMVLIVTLAIIFHEKYQTSKEDRELEKRRQEEHAKICEEYDGLAGALFDGDYKCE